LADIPIYNRDGTQRNAIHVDDNLTFLGGRVSKGDKAYYKGVGCPYKGHHTLTPNQEYVVGKSPVWYSGYVVTNPKLNGKFGIFYQPYQPYFSDFVGSCGPKETNIIANSKAFPLSSVKYIDCVHFDTENKQQYFVLDYSCGRTEYLKEGQASNLSELIECLITTGWNFPWDKAAIRDVSGKGTVSDVADMFKSTKPIHQFGTVYSLLYSLFQLSRPKFFELMQLHQLSCKTDKDIPLVAIYFLDKHGANTDSLLPKKQNTNVYSHLILKLIDGRNCAYVEHETYGDSVKKQYHRKFKESGNAATTS
jgi:hypothetical protein